jgi:DNA repair protein RadC
MNKEPCRTPLFAKTAEGFEPVPNMLLLECARLVLQAHFRPGASVLKNRELLHDFVHFELGTRDHETFALILLDGRDQLIEYVELFRGTIDFANVHTRPIVECALKYKAAAAILVHNHPSGRCKPSLDDRALTDRVKRALALVDVGVVDHLVVGEKVYSFADEGLLRASGVNAWSQADGAYN